MTPSSAPPRAATSPPRTRFIIGFGVVLAFFVAIRLAAGIDQALHFDGPAVDGPFQLFNALRRIAAGQRAGVGFQFFHGIAIPFLHYPLFRLLGGDLYASELARQTITILAAPLISLVFFWFFTRDRATTIALTTIVYLAELAFPLGSIVQPAVSMLGLRSTMPLLVAVAMIAVRSPRGRVIGVGLALGFALLLGTEQGLAAFLAFLLVGGLSLYRTRLARERVAEIVGAAGVAIVALMAGSLLLGGWSGMLGSLRYNLVLVPRDQYWYFGAPASYFLPDWRSLPHMLRQMPGIPLAIVLGLVATVVALRRVRRTPDETTRRDAEALAFLSIYGLISCASILGIFHEVYAQPCLRALMLIGALDLARWVERRPVRAARVARYYVALAAALAIAVALRVHGFVTDTVLTLPHVVDAHVLGGHGGQAAGIWPDALRIGDEVMRSAPRAGGPSPALWSTYAGWLEARHGVLNPTPFDYMMHALGPANRAAYLAVFNASRPFLVQTVSPAYASAEIWMEQTSWDFYDALLRHYVAVAGSPWSIFWMRRTDSLPSPRALWRSELTPNASTVELPVTSRVTDTSSYVLLEVELEYDTRSALRRLPVVGAWPRYFVEIENAAARYPVTLDPWTTVQRFPVVAARGRDPTLRLHVYSLLPGARLTPRRVVVSEVPIGNNARWFELLTMTELARSRPGPGGDTTGVYRWR